jgi:hypothetical protein
LIPASVNRGSRGTEPSVTRQHTRRASLLAVTAILLSLAGCTPPEPKAAPGAAASPATAQRSAATSVSPQATELAAGVGDGRIQDAYRHFWQIVQRVDQQPQARWRAILATVVTEPLLSQIVDRLQTTVRGGYRQYGSVIPHPEVVQVTAGRASVLDCQGHCCIDGSRVILTVGSSVSRPARRRLKGSPRPPHAPTAAAQGPEGIARRKISHQDHR